MSLSERTLVNGWLSLLVSDMASSATQGRLREFDGLRGLAMILGLVWRCIARLIQIRPGLLGAYGLRMLGVTGCGVDIFYVLSGFLIGDEPIRRRERGFDARGILIRPRCLAT